MNEEELVSYVVRYCKHELSEEEYRFLQRWLEEKQENRQTFRGFGGPLTFLFPWRPSARRNAPISGYGRLHSLI